MLEPVVDPEAALAPDAPLVHEAAGHQPGLRARRFTSATSSAIRRGGSGRLATDCAGTGRAVSRSRPSVRSRATTRDRDDDDPHELAELHELPVHARGNAEDSGRTARHAAASGRRQLRIEAVRDQGRGDRRDAAQGRGPPGQVRGGSDRQSLQLRPPRLRSVLRHRAGGDARRYAARGFGWTMVDDYGAYIQFGLGTTATRWPRSSARTGSGASSTGQAACSRTSASRAPTAASAPRSTTSCSSGSSISRPASCGVDPVELRRRNFIRTEQFPYKIPDRQRVRQRRLRGGARQGARARRLTTLAREQERRAQGGSPHRHRSGHVPGAQRLRGERVVVRFDRGSAPSSRVPESITLSVDATGDVTATLYSSAFWGNSPETMVAQCVAEEFDVEPRGRGVVYAGTRTVCPATGPGGSRFTVMIAGAIEGAAERIKEKAFKVADLMLEANPDDLEWSCPVASRSTATRIRASRSPRSRCMPRLFKHSLPEDIDSGFEAQHGLRPSVYDPYHRRPHRPRGVLSDSSATPATSRSSRSMSRPERSRFLKYVAVHDCGTLVNPRSLAGHIIGGVAQGIGTDAARAVRLRRDRQAAHVRAISIT